MPYRKTGLYCFIRRSNLVDHMMETYANQLEELVKERTQQLAEEQKKTDELLCRMLPRLVVHELPVSSR